MKRCLKKAVAFGLALSMFASCMVVSAEENEGNGIAVIEDAVYDEAVSFLDTVVLLENGHWAKRVKDEVTGERVPYTDVTAETNIVFIDGEGNKKVISNKDANGEMIFDAVLPEITNLDSNDFICVFKGENRAYISPEGEFFGETLKFYKDVRYISDDYLLVSENGEKYDLINKAGEVVYSIDGFDWAALLGDYFYAKTKEKVVVVRESDMTIVKEYAGASNFTKINDEYVRISITDGVVVLNSKAEEVLSGYDMSYCYNVEYSTDYLLIEIKTESGEKIYKLVNMITSETVAQYTSRPEIYPDGFILDENSGVFSNIEGTVNVDLNGYTEQILQECGGNYAGKVDYYYENGILYFSEYRAEEDKSCTYIVGTKDGYKTTELVKVKGLITAIDNEKERYILKSSSGTIYGLYNLSGELIKDFSDYTENSYETHGHLFPFMDNILTNAFVTVDGKSNNVFIKSDGSIVGQYETVKDHGGFIFGGTVDGKLEVLNSDGEIVFSETGLYEPKPIDSSPYAIKFIKNAYGLKHKDYFTIMRDGICSLYDFNGNAIEVGDNYSAIGPCGGIIGSYEVGEGSYAGYNYENEDLANGLCVTRKTDADGNHKYGVIKFNVVLEKGDCNGDKLINAQDALAVLKHAAKITILPDESVGEVTGDGLVNAQDALKILKLAAHVIEAFGM